MQVTTFHSVTRQLQWWTEASGWPASAACSQHPTACVGYSRGSTTILTSYVARGQISTEWRTSILITGRASTAGTIIILMWILMANHVEETSDKRTICDPRSSPALRRCLALFNLSNRCTEKRWKKDMGGPLRTTGIARGPPSRGWLTCKVYAKPCASSR
jgi:hypothetical protein